MEELREGVPRTLFVAFRPEETDEPLAAHAIAARGEKRHDGELTPLTDGWVDQLRNALDVEAAKGAESKDRLMVRGAAGRALEHDCLAGHRCSTPCRGWRLTVKNGVPDDPGPTRRTDRIVGGNFVWAHHSPIRRGITSG